MTDTIQLKGGFVGGFPRSNAADAIVVDGETASVVRLEEVTKQSRHST